MLNLAIIDHYKLKLMEQLLGFKQNEVQKQLISKATLQLQQKVTSFFYNQNHIIAKLAQKVIILNTLTKNKEIVDVSTEDFILQQLPPYLFVIMEGKCITAYKTSANGLQKPIAIRISKLQPRSICRFNKGYYLGGYNRSFLPGNKRTFTRKIIFLQKLKLEQKNVADDSISLADSDCPVSVLKVQNPYIFAYCRPVVYLISISSKDILITFQKDATHFLLLEGRFALASANGVGISSKRTLFTFDIERFPIFGVQINENKTSCDTVCMERTGRIFGGAANTVFEYHPIKQSLKCVVKYKTGEFIVWMSCTPSNSLMVMRYNLAGKCVIDVYSLE